MQYGMYISASAVSTAMARQDVLSNNLANVNTVGFRPDTLHVRQRQAAAQEDGLTSLPSHKLLERLGGGVLPAAMRLSTAQGPIQETANTLDLALEGSGFFVTRSPNPREGEDPLRLTRDGRLTARTDGTLVTAGSGLPVLSDSGSEIRINMQSNQPLQIDFDGTVRQGKSEAGRLRVADVPEPSMLIKDGDNLLRPNGQAMIDGTAQVRSRHVELSGVDAIRSMIGVTSASNAASTGLTMISYYSDMMSRAIVALGRVT